MTHVSTLASNLNLTDNQPEAKLKLNQLMLPQNFGGMTSVKKALVTVPVRKPGNQTYFRVSNLSENSGSFALIELKDEGVSYVVIPSLCSELNQEVRPKKIYLAVTREGSPFLWPVSLPGEDGRLDTWSESAHASAELAKTTWVRLVSNRGIQAYDAMVAENLSIEPTWPEKSFEDLIQLGFKGRIIDSVDHPVIRRLRGEI